MYAHSPPGGDVAHVTAAHTTVLGVWHEIEGLTAGLAAVELTGEESWKAGAPDAMKDLLKMAG